MAIKALVSIAGHDLPEPSTYNAVTTALVESGTNAAGHMIGAVIRDEIASVELGWRFLSAEQWAQILSLFKESAGGSYVNPVTFFDQSAGTWVTREMYVSDRSAPMWRRDPQSGLLLGWSDCKLTLTEV